MNDISALLKPLIDGKQFVVVQQKNHVLVFLVDDAECPNVPGHPAAAVRHFNDAETARNMIEKTYSFLNYQPENKGWLNTYRQKLKI